MSGLDIPHGLALVGLFDQIGQRNVVEAIVQCGGHFAAELQ
jgi:hypothetical protein